MNRSNPDPFHFLEKDLDPIKIQKKLSAIRIGNCCVQFLTMYVGQMWPNSERDLLNAKGCRIWIPLTIENFAFSRVRAEKLKEEGGELEAGVRTALDDEDAWARSGH